ncbi:MAG: DNA gyrase inhibitor YacG [Alphaproteobacteria bacterium]|nr:MAG: DNA gyrase inhibitor YacG [Alphaproteobacteria bacterium]
MSCPICGKETARAYRPFCSRRCADVDLGRWLGGQYAIPGEPVELPDEDEASLTDRQATKPH